MNHPDVINTDTLLEPSYRQDEVTRASLEYFKGDELAASTFVSKYALKRKVGPDLLFAEFTPADMHDRIAHEFARVDGRYPNPRPESEFREVIDHFRYIVPQGSPMYGIGNPYVRVSLSNCVVVESPLDNLSGIMETGKELANLFKRRCGVGVDISTLRPDGAAVSNAAGTSTGAWSFADFFSTVCRMVGQNGRRGALMITMDVRHPDIEKFVTMKRDLTKVTGANISVMLTDEFMQAVENDAEWVCHWPVDAPVEEARSKRTVRARDLWYLINESAVKCAEPGLLFWDNYARNLPANCYPDFKLICVNPCSEIGLSAYDSCRLISQNLKSYVRSPFTPEASFDFELFEKHVRLAMRMMDDMVDLEIEHLSDIIEHVDEDEERVLWGKLRQAAVKGRRTGLGCHGLADALSGLRLRYDSPEAVQTVDRIFRLFRDSAYDESVTLAEERGPFEVFDWQLEKNCDFIQRLPQALQDRMARHGRRNISVLTMAPTGSVSILAQTSSGIEPVFMNFYTRRKKVNPSDNNVQVDFIDQNGDRWEEFPVFHHNVMEYLEATPEAMARWEDIRLNLPKSQWAAAIAEILPPFFVTSMQIDPRRRVEIQGVIQQYIDHGISSTINMPAGTTVEQGQELYYRAWKHGLKGVTIYVDGCRTGVLVGATEKKDASTEKSAQENAGQKNAAVQAPAPDEEMAAGEAVAVAQELAIRPLSGESAADPAPPPAAAAELAAPAVGSAAEPAAIGSVIAPRPRKLRGTTYKIQTPVGEAYCTINDAPDGAFELFINIAKAGSTVAADAEAIGRLCSLILRMPSVYSRTERAKQIVRQLEGIGGERSAGLGKQRVRSLADAVAQVVREHCGLSDGMHGAPTTEVNGAASLPSAGTLAGATPAANGHTNGYAEVGLPIGDLCPECGHATYIAEGGCHTCHTCGYAEC